MNRIFIAVLLAIAVGFTGCHKKHPQNIPDNSTPTPVVIQDPTPVPAPVNSAPAPATPAPQTPGIPTVTLPKDDNAVPVHVIIPPPEQKGLKK